VTKQGEVRALASTWKVLVTLDVPTAPTALRDEIHQVTRVVASAPVSISTRQAWRRRLRKIELALPSLASPSPTTPLLPGRVRNPRGLLDPLGVLVHDIFGLATSAEVANIKTVLQSVGDNQAAIVTKLDLLTTVVNRSRIYEQENREFLNKLSSQFSNTQQILYNLTRRFNILSLRVAMEQVLEDLEIQADTMHSFQALYAHRRQDLHNLKLSEELLPISSLENILATASTYDAVPLSDINWYYTHESVRPLWATPDFLVFEVNLPLVRPSTFLLYHIQGWPVPTGPSLSVTIVQTGEFGYDTNSGQLFEATHCVGLAPKVCSSGPLFKTGFPPCVRGILKGDHELMGNCKVAVSPGNASHLSYFAANEYILSTWGDVLEARCTGQNARTVSISKGVYHILLPRSCSLSGPAWTISAIALHHLHLHLLSKQLTRPRALNLSALLASSPISLPHVSPQFKLPSLAPMPLAALRETFLRPIQFPDAQSHLLRNMLIATAILLFISVLVLLSYLHRARWLSCLLQPESRPGRPVRATRSAPRPARRVRRASSQTRGNHESLELDPMSPRTSPPAGTDTTPSSAVLPDALFQEVLRNLHVNERRAPVVTYSNRTNRKTFTTDSGPVARSPPRTHPIYEDLQATLATTDEKQNPSSN
jgi:hypothetical protein